MTINEKMEKYKYRYYDLKSDALVKLPTAYLEVDKEFAKCFELAYQMDVKDEIILKHMQQQMIAYFKNIQKVIKEYIPEKE